MGRPEAPLVPVALVTSAVCHDRYGELKAIARYGEKFQQLFTSCVCVRHRGSDDARGTRIVRFKTLQNNYFAGGLSHH